MDDREESALAMGRPHGPQRVADSIEEGPLAVRPVALRGGAEGAGERRIGCGQPAVGRSPHVLSGDPRVVREPGRAEARIGHGTLLIREQTSMIGGGP
jgi:hypothetical protein